MRGKVGRWFRCGLLCLLLLLLAGCVAAPRGRMEGYRELAAWLDLNALPDETVAVQEQGAWVRLTDLPLALLSVGGDAFALLARLQELRPDYCVALRSVAWEGVQAAPWFQEHYQQVVVAMVVDDSASPLVLYRYRPSPFDRGGTLLLEHTLYDEAVGSVTVEWVQLSSQRLTPGELVYVSLALRGDVREPLRAVWQLRTLDGERVWLREVRTLSPVAWPVAGTLTERYIIAPPDALPMGEYALELTFMRPNRASFGETVLLATLSRPPDVTRTLPTSDYPLNITAGEALALVGYDASESLAPGDTLRVALYWHAQGVVAGDFKVFVHVLGADGTRVAQSDAVPVYWTYPTTAWQPGDYVRDVHVIPLDAALPRGDYRIVMGMYDPVTGERLAWRDAQGTLPDGVISLGVLRVR